MKVELSEEEIMDIMSALYKVIQDAIDDTSLEQRIMIKLEKYLER
jgi:hypothetical protein